MLEIILTKEEKRKLKKNLYMSLDIKSEYHTELCPLIRENVDSLMLKYFYWADIYNDDYIPEKNYSEDNKLAMYLVQEFDRFMAIPLAIRY